MEEMSSGEVLEVAARLRGLDRERKRIAASRVRSVCGQCAAWSRCLSRLCCVLLSVTLQCRCRQEVEAWAARVGEEVAAARRELLARVEAAHGQGQVQDNSPSTLWQVGCGEELVLVADPRLEELLEGGLGSLTTSPLLPSQLRLHLATLPLRPGVVASCTVVGAVPLPTATLHSLTITASLRGEAVGVEVRVEEQGLVAEFLVERAGVYLVAATLSSQHVQGSPLAIPVLQDPATLGTLGMLARPGLVEGEGKEHGSTREQREMELKKKAQERDELEKKAQDQEAHKREELESKDQKRDQEKIVKEKEKQEKIMEEKKDKEKRDKEKREQETKDQEKKEQETKEQEMLLKKRDQGYVDIGGLTPGRRCFVRQEGAWHGALVHQVVHAGLVTVRNLTLGQYRGAGPGELVLAAQDIPRGQQIATSARQLQRDMDKEEEKEKAKALEKKLLEEKALELEVQEKKEERNALKVKEKEERKAHEQKRQAQEMKEQEGKAEEVKERGAAEGLAGPGGSRKWRVGSTCLAKWPEDRVWYRAEVVAVAAGNYTVLFTDYGDEAEVVEEEVVAAVTELPAGADIDVHLEEEWCGAPPGTWAEGEECVAKREVDGVWCRATVLQTLDQGDTLVLLKDYGTEAVVGRGEVVRYAAEVPEGEPSDHSVVVEVPVEVEREEEGEACVARWSDGVWYQAVVEEVQEGGAVVTFTDYGNSDYVPWEQVCITLKKGW